MFIYLFIFPSQMVLPNFKLSDCMVVIQGPLLASSRIERHPVFKTKEIIEGYYIPLFVSPVKQTYGAGLEQDTVAIVFELAFHIGHMLLVVGVVDVAPTHRAIPLTVESTDNSGRWKSWETQLR